MNIRMTGIILLLLCTVFLMGMGSCDRSKSAKTSPPRAETAQTDNSPAKQTPPPPEQENEDKEEPMEINPNSSLSKREYGRENPFEPVVRSSRSGRTRTTNRSSVTQKKATASKPESEITLGLTGILGENLAIFNNNGVDKSVSVGDMVAGMAVLEIQIDEGRVILGKGDEKLTIGLGAQIKL
ncbi:hypothetical protein ACFL6S_26290 [Candidatus Poribacteria bacterium]